MLKPTTAARSSFKSRRSGKPTAGLRIDAADNICWATQQDALTTFAAKIPSRLPRKSPDEEETDDRLAE